MACNCVNWPQFLATSYSNKASENYKYLSHHPSYHYPVNNLFEDNLMGIQFLRRKIWVLPNWKNHNQSIFLAPPPHH